MERRKEEKDKGRRKRGEKGGENRKGKRREEGRRRKREKKGDGGEAKGGDRGKRRERREGETGEREWEGRGKTKGKERTLYLQIYYGHGVGQCSGRSAKVIEGDIQCVTKYCSVIGPHYIVF